MMNRNYIFLKTNYNMKTFVINLDERKDRLQHIQKVGKKLKLDLHRISAVKGIDLKMDTLPVSSFVKTSLKLKKRFSKIHLTEYGEVGCFLSHRKIWEQVQNEGESCLVLEDDADPLPQASEYLNRVKESNYDLIILGIHEGKFSPQIQSFPNWLDTGKLLTGSCAYILTSSAAKKLYEASHVIDLSVDLFLPTVIQNIGFIHLFNQAFFWKRADILHVSDQPLIGIIVSSFLVGILCTIIFQKFLGKRPI